MTYLEQAKLSYLFFPYNISEDEIKEELSRIHKEGNDILFIEPEVLKLFRLTDIIEEVPVLTLLENYAGETIGFYLPNSGKEPYISTYSDIINRSIDRAKSESLEDDYGRQQSSGIT